MDKKNNLYSYRSSVRFLTQEKLANDIGVSRQTIINLENGVFYPSLELAFKISKYFNCKIEDIWIL